MKILPVVNSYNKSPLAQAGKAPVFSAAPESKVINSILKSPTAQKIFKFADINPFGFKILALAVACIIFRPITVMAMPGQKKDDKQYLAAKSVIAATIADLARLALCLPLAMGLKAMGKKAKANPSIKFPAIETEKFKVFNFAVNEGFAFILQIGTAALMTMAIPKVMSRILPSPEQKRNVEEQAKTKDGGAL